MQQYLQAYKAAGTDQRQEMKRNWRKAAQDQALAGKHDIAAYINRLLEKMEQIDGKEIIGE